MSDEQMPRSEPDWLNEFEELANRELTGGPTCEQVHPVMERWYAQLMESEPPASRDAIMQAVSCLATEIVNNAPEDLVEAVLDEGDEDALANLVEYVLMIGRAFEIAVRRGEFDDL